MSGTRPYVLSIAGFDPSAGAGLLADVKTFEQMDVYGLGAVSALTFQNDQVFEKVDWLSVEQIMDQVSLLQERFRIGFIKIGLIRDLSTLLSLLGKLQSRHRDIKIIWDPVLRSSSGFGFHQEIDPLLLKKICSGLFLITPNTEEALRLGPGDAVKNARMLSRCCNVYLKGGHHPSEPGTDRLFSIAGEEIVISSGAGKLLPKHGSGCVLSSAITASLAKGASLEQACREAKAYIEDFLQSNETMLGYHHFIKTNVHE